jgi:hypothetical protein
MLDDAGASATGSDSPLFVDDACQTPTRSDRRQLLRNSGDLIRQGSEVLRLRGRGSSGALKKAIDLLGLSGNGLTLLRGRSGNGAGGRAREEIVDLLGQRRNSLNQSGSEVATTAWAATGAGRSRSALSR